MEVTPEFRTHAAKVLGETVLGLSGTEIIEETCGYAAKFGRSLTYSSTPKMGPNKRTMLAKNLACFSDEEVLQVLTGLCDHKSVAGLETVKELKAEIIRLFGSALSFLDAAEVDVELLESARSWLTPYEAAFEQFESGISKLAAGVYSRNVLDDMRLAFELLLKELNENNQSLEKQNPHIGRLLKDHGANPHIAAMYQQVMNYFKNYQNEAAKHGSTYDEREIVFVVEITSSLMKAAIRFLGDKD